MQQEQLIAQMRERVAKCRRLADTILDESAARALREMADDGEADIARLLAEGQQTTSDAVVQNPLIPPST